MSPLVAVQPSEAAGHSRSRACPLIARRLNLGRRHQRLRGPTVKKGVPRWSRRFGGFARSA